MAQIMGGFDGKTGAQKLTIVPKSPVSLMALMATALCVFGRFSQFV